MSQKPRRPNIRSPQKPKPRAIVAIDPGTTTGIAVYWIRTRAGHRVPRERAIEVFQFGSSDTEHRLMARKLRSLSPIANPAIIVYEQYIARPSRHGLVGAEAQKALSPVFIHGYVVGLMESIRNPLQMPAFHPQQASEMANFPDKRLKAMFPNLYALTLRPAKPHARDALRHLLTYLKRHHFDAYQALKPPQTETAD